MKRTFAVVALLAALGVLSKLALKPKAPSAELAEAPSAVSGGERADGRGVPDPQAELRQQYANRPAVERELVARVVDRFRQNAVAIDRTDGFSGLKFLDRLDLEAVYLYEKHPKEFHRLRELLNDDAAADVLLHWREYFGLKRTDDADRAILVAELAQLNPIQRRLAARYPSALPSILADPVGVTGLLETFHGDETAMGEALVVLSMISLERGTSDLRAGLRTIEDHPALALDAFRQQGLQGFALVCLYGPVLEALGSSLPLDQSLIVLRVNSEYVDEFLQTHQPETLASHLGHVAAKGLVQAVGGGAEALRLVVEFGEPGERALSRAGADAADVVFGDFADPVLRNQAVAALAEHGPMALFILDKYAADPDFREILRSLGGAIIPPIAHADSGPETLAVLQSKDRRSFSESLAKMALLASGDNGQAVIRTIKKDGLERVAYLNRGEIRFYQFLPLYDVLHLGNVLSRGHSPTSGEMTWALVDGCFVIADVLSLAAIQPEAAVAAEAVRSEVKAAAREGARSVGRELAEAGGETAGKSVTLARASRESLGAGGTAAAEAASRRAARWWTVRSAGGVYPVLQRLPDALPRMSLTQVVDMARPLCVKAGIRPSSWKPIQLLKAGVAIPLQIPPERGVKYLAAQMLQASVGVVGFQKMEEHMASRRPRGS